MLAAIFMKYVVAKLILLLATNILMLIFVSTNKFNVIRCKENGI